MNFKEELEKQGLEIPYSVGTDCFSEPIVLYGKKLSNRIGILPLEGFDSKEDGSPSEYVCNRYLRFAKGGAGLIWFEACAVSEDGKSNPAQMMLHEGNVGEFKDLLAQMDEISDTFKVLQLTHSGRMSKNDKWEEIPLSPKNHGEQDRAEYATDARIEKIVRDHICAAKLAAEAGFDAVDVKVCHGYFLSELLSAYDRKGKYGGSFENRTRAIFEIIDGIREQLGDRIGISVRLNAYDSVPYPYGYGISEENGEIKADLSETVELCKRLRNRGVQLINISASSPNNHLFGPEPTEMKYKKYVSSCDLIMATKLLKENVEGVTFMCTGLSSFGAEGGYVGAGGIKDGWFDIAGFGRQALAYPDFASDLLNAGKPDKNKCCINCNQCFRLMDRHSRVYCTVRT